MSEKKIGRYEIKDELGKGGMATVYLAYDPQLEREVALKLLPSYFAHDPEFSARFSREAKTVAALEHGAIVSMYDYGEDIGPYFVMRLMKGGSLKERIQEGPMDLKDAAHIVKRIAEALDKAHSRDIVHRDLKPGNIMFDEDGEAYLGDFGIVKLAQSSESYTRTGNTLGTPAYMSPEQADGRPDIDGRSDTYALGIILYEMLTGTAPYVHESMPRLLVMHLTHPIPNILEARADLPSAIQGVIEKAMAKERDNRYATPLELSTDLNNILQGKAPIVAQTTSAPASLPQPEPEPEPAVASAAPTRAAAVEIPSTPAPKPTPTPTPAPERTPIPAPPPAPSTPAGKGGGLPKWAYAVIGVVGVAIIGGAIAIFSGGGDDPPTPTPGNTNQVTGGNTGTVVEDPTNTPEPVEEPTDTPEPVEEPTDTPEPVEVVVNPGTNIEFIFGDNMLDFPDGWAFTDWGDAQMTFIEGGSAIFETEQDATYWTYFDPVVLGDGIYTLVFNFFASTPGETSVGLLFNYDSELEDWYELLIDSDGSAMAFYCTDACDGADEPLFEEWIFDNAIEGESGNTNVVEVVVDQGTITYLVNGVEIGFVQENRLEFGNAGLIFYGNGSALGVQIEYMSFAPFEEGSVSPPEGTGGDYQIVFDSWMDGDVDIYVMNVDDQEMINLTDNDFSDFLPRWSPDGNQIAYISNETDSEWFEIMVMNTDGSGKTQLTQSEEVEVLPTWSPDGTMIAYIDDGLSLKVINADGETGQEPEILYEHPGGFLIPALSDWNESGIYLTACQEPYNNDLGSWYAENFCELILLLESDGFTPEILHDGGAGQIITDLDDVFNEFSVQTWVVDSSDCRIIVNLDIGNVISPEGCFTLPRISPDLSRILAISDNSLHVLDESGWNLLLNDVGSADWRP